MSDDFGNDQVDTSDTNESDEKASNIERFLRLQAEDDAGMLMLSHDDV